MKTEEQVREKLKELQADLKTREARWNPFGSKKNELWIEFLKNDIAFVKWMLDEPCCKCYCHNGSGALEG